MIWPPFPAPRIHDPAEAHRLLAGESLLLSYHLKTLRDMLVEQFERPDLSLGREALARLLGERLLDPERLRRAQAGLSAEERYLLACIKDAGGQLLPEALLQQAARAGVADAPRALERLVLLGLALFPFNPHPRLRRQERYRADRPEAPLWLHPLVLERTESSAYIPARLPSAEREPERTRGARLTDFLGDLLLVWQRVGLERPRLLRGGHPAIRLARAIVPLLIAPGSAVPDWATHPRLSLLLALARSEGWLVETNGVLASAPGRPAQALCARPGHEIGQRLLESWLRLESYQEIRHIPGLSLERELEYYATGRERFQERLQQARTFLVARLQQCPPGVWISTDRLTAYARQIAPDLLWPLPERGGPARYRRMSIAGLGNEPPREGNWDRVEGALLGSMLEQVLHPLGLIDLGEPGLFRITAAGAYALGTGPEPPLPPAAKGRAAAILQPNFEILVFRDRIVPAQYETLLAFARKQRGDALDHLQLDQGSVAWGQERGLAAEELLTALQAATGQPASQNVAYSLRAWCRRRGSIRIVRDATLRRESLGGPWELALAGHAGPRGRRAADIRPSACGWVPLRTQREEGAPIAGSAGASVEASAGGFDSAQGRNKPRLTCSRGKAAEAHLPADPRAIVIKPDGQILADLALLDPVTEAYLGMTCRTLWREAREAAFELDPAALAAAAAAGRVRVLGLIARLACCSRTDLPARQRLRWWTAVHPGTAIRLDPHLHVPDGSPLIEWLLQLPEIRGLIERAGGGPPRARAGRRRELRRRLQDLGVKPEGRSRS